MYIQAKRRQDLIRLVCLFAGIGRRGPRTAPAPPSRDLRPARARACDGLGRGRGGAMAVREGAAGPGGARDPGASPAPRRVAVGRPGQTRFHDVRDVQHVARFVSHETVQVAEQVRFYRGEHVSTILRR